MDKLIDNLEYLRQAKYRLSIVNFSKLLNIPKQEYCNTIYKSPYHINLSTLQKLSKLTGYSITQLCTKNIPHDSIKVYRNS